MGHHETDGAKLLFEQVRDEPRSSRQYGHTLQCGRRVPYIEKERGDRTRHGQWQGVSKKIRPLALDLPPRLHVRTHASGFPRHIKQALDSWVGNPVQKIALSGQWG